MEVIRFDGTTDEKVAIGRDYPGRARWNAA
jgi:hypothetical protein